MKKTIAGIVCAVLNTGIAVGAPLTLCDFEGYEVGTKFPIWNFYNESSQSTAIVEADPANPANKVLHITLKGWNDYIEFTLPDNLSGSRLTDAYNFVNIMVYRHPEDPCGEWKHFDALLGSDKLYEDDGWPAQGPTSTWMKKTYPLAAPQPGNNSTLFRLGYNSENTDYYIDDIILSGKYDDYVIHEEGVLDFSDPSSTSSNYTRYSTPINIPKDKSLKVYTSRYTYWMSDMIGEGSLSIYGGGERCYIGNEKGAAHPDWSEFKGDIHVYPYPEVNTSVKAGFYGVILAHGGKKFNSDNIPEAISKRDLTTIWENNYVTLHDGATLSAESNNTARAFRIGTLKTEKGSKITGYYKNSQYRVYYIVGCSGTDSELAGEISPTGNSKTGIVKEGKGTYRITGNTNNISGSLSVIDGRVLIDNNIEEAKASGLSGAVGTSSNDAAAVIVYPYGTIGGNGHIAGLTDIYGTLEPGSETPGTLTIADFVKPGNKIDMRVRPTTRLRFKINSSESYDHLEISGALSYHNKNIGLQTSEQMPVLEIAVPENHSIKAGDRFTLITASSKSSLNDVKWSFRVQYPKACTWKIEESESDGEYKAVATVTSLDYSGQGDEIITIDPEDENDNTEFYVDYSSDFNDATPMRQYAAKSGKRIGAAASTWKYNIADATNPKVKALAEQFNMVVAENEMKFDATEPERGKFDYSGGDAVANFAKANSMYLRGHTFVWHSQCPQWVSSNGIKNDRNWSREELLSIMENHIMNVGTHYKGIVNEWDVVNEMLDDDQSVVRDNPEAFNLRKSVWETVIGADYIEKALEIAHRADPDAKLFINEYGAEFMGEPKSEALYNLAKSLVEKGAPLHGVGLQCHLTTGEVKVGKLAANIRRYQELGLECVITELDLAQADTKAPDAERIQAEEYGAIVNAALSQSNCAGVLVWGVSDADSWRANKPLLYDASANPKEAYYAVHAATRIASENAGIEEIIPDSTSEIIRVEYYNIQGMRLHDTAKGLVIKREYHADGSITHKKEYRR